MAKQASDTDFKTIDRVCERLAARAVESADPYADFDGDFDDIGV